MDRQFLGDYELIKLIDKDPLGDIYHAQHRFLKRYYSLKILPEELAKNPKFIERLKKQIVGLSALNHENLVKIHNISEADDKYFIVSDLILDSYGEHTDIGRLLSRTSQELSEESIFSILYQIALALDYIHENTLEDVPIVHRYLNLHSVLIGKTDDRSFQVFLSDTGLASIIGEGALITRTYASLAEALALSASSHAYDVKEVEESKLSRLHKCFLESYPFLSPEQKQTARGFSITPKTDVFAFGVLAYYMLVREYPEGFFRLPSSLLPFKFNWDPLIYHCLSKDPSKRPTSLAIAMKAVRNFDSKQHIEQIDEWKAHQSVPIDRQIPKEKKGQTTQKVAQSYPDTKVHNPSIKEIVSQLSEEKAFKTQPIDSPKSSVADNIALKAQQQATKYTVAHQDESGGVCVMESTEIDTDTADLKPDLKPAELEKPKFEPDPAIIFQSEAVIAPYKPQEKETVDLQPIPTDMVVIPGGEFYRGCNEGARDEKPYHKISLDSFAIDIHPCTNQQFVRFLEVMGGEKDHNNNDLIRLRESRIKRSGGKLMIESGYTDHPVVGITWYGAVAYAKWVGKRLPTEAEWEVAARCMKCNMLYPTGDEIEKDQSNFFSSDTTAVKTYAPNELGLYDMAGNVYEWCQDWYDYAYYDVSQIEPYNPPGPPQGVYRVLRGGCWKSLKEDLRCSHRHRNNPGSIDRTYGFRCAADVTHNT